MRVRDRYFPAFIRRTSGASLAAALLLVAPVAQATEESEQPLREAVERCEVIVVAEAMHASGTVSEKGVVPTVVEYDIRIVRSLRWWVNPLMTYRAVYYRV